MANERTAAEYEVREWMGENDVVLKTPAFRALIELVLAAQSAAALPPVAGEAVAGAIDARNLPRIVTPQMVAAWASAELPPIRGLSDEEANRVTAQADWTAMLDAALASREQSPASPDAGAGAPSGTMVDMTPPATARDRWMYEQGRLAERDPRTPGTRAAFIEECCARIKAADDAAADGDYMLDSNDCISVLRGTWTAPLANDCPAAAPASAPEPSPLLMQDENSGRDGRRYNEWHASRPEARLNARDAAAGEARSVTSDEDTALRQAAPAKLIARGRPSEAPEQQGEYPQLLPCPFCGTPAELIDRPDGPLLVGAFAGCDHCGIHTPIKLFATDAIAAWNLRAQAAMATGKVGAVADALHAILADACDADSETNVSAELYRRGYEALSTPVPTLQAETGEAQLTAAEVCASREAFINGFVSRSHAMTRDRFDELFIALPCDCDYDDCKGWAAISKNPESILGHLNPSLVFQLYALIRPKVSL